MLIPIGACVGIMVCDMWSNEFKTASRSSNGISHIQLLQGASLKVISMALVENCRPLTVLSALKTCQNAKFLDFCSALAQYRKWQLLFTIDKLPCDILRHIAKKLDSNSRVAFYKSLHGVGFGDDLAQARLSQSIKQKLAKIAHELQALRYYGTVLIFADTSVFTPQPKPIARIWVHNLHRIFAESFIDIAQLEKRAQTCVSKNLPHVTLLGYVDTESTQDLLFITSTAPNSQRDLENWM